MKIINKPAIVNLIKDIVNGCESVNPILEATDAEAQSAAKGNPISQ
ncbi:MAG: hypothetical protein RJB42_235 [Bacteroidota bacterium]